MNLSVRYTLNGSTAYIKRNINMRRGQAASTALIAVEEVRVADRVDNDESVSASTESGGGGGEVSTTLMEAKGASGFQLC